MAATAKVTPINPEASVIEKGIPMPVGHSGTGITARVRALAAADIGDSVLFSDRESHSARRIASTLLGSGWAVARKAADGGVRIWKRAEPKAR